MRSFLSEILPPDNVHVQGISERGVVVSWFPPDVDFNCIDGYEVVWTNSKYPEETGSQKVDRDTYSLAISNLSNYFMPKTY